MNERKAFEEKVTRIKNGNATFRRSSGALGREIQDIRRRNRTERRAVAMEEGEDVTPAREEPRRSRSSQVASSPVVRP